MSTFKPMGPRVLVRRAPTETKTSSGFIIPDAATEKANQGTVLAVGGGRVTDTGVVIPVEVNVNDEIMFIQGAGSNIKVDGEELLVLREEDIIAVVS